MKKKKCRTYKGRYGFTVHEPGVNCSHLISNSKSSKEDISELLRIGCGLDDNQTEIAKNILKPKLEEAKAEGATEERERLQEQWPKIYTEIVELFRFHKVPFDKHSTADKIYELLFGKTQVKRKGK